MKNMIYSSLQLREIFHLEFLRWLGKAIKVEFYVLKGGTNMRFFFNSFRYSEDMDLDVTGITVERLKAVVMKILKSATFQEGFIPFGILQIVPPNIKKAKQTETTQRFKIHLVTTQGTDLFTKVEFSRRGINGKACTESVLNHILRMYKLPPLIVPHYDISSAISQKINALATRMISQARDVFDLYVLSTQYIPSKANGIGIVNNRLRKAITNIYDISFARFRDSALAFLSIEDQATYNSPAQWDEVRLKVVDFINEFSKKHD